MTHQVQSGSLQDVHQLLQLGVGREDEVVVHPQQILGGHLGDGQVPPSEPTLKHNRTRHIRLKSQQQFSSLGPSRSHLPKGHDVMFDVGPRDGFGVLAVVSDHYGDGWIVPSDAVDKILKLVVPQERLCSHGNEGADVILCRGGGTGELLAGRS